jgi:hypothetical protein
VGRSSSEQDGRLAVDGAQQDKHRGTAIVPPVGGAIQVPQDKRRTSILLLIPFEEVLALLFGQQREGHRRARCGKALVNVKMHVRIIRIIPVTFGCFRTIVLFTDDANAGEDGQLAEARLQV